MCCVSIIGLTTLSKCVIYAYLAITEMNISWFDKTNVYSYTVMEIKYFNC